MKDSRNSAFASLMEVGGAITYHMAGFRGVGGETVIRRAKQRLAKLRPRKNINSAK